MSEQVLERFHRALIEEIQTQRPEYLTQPFTVAEIYQNLVPYGSHRERIGVEMNGDYEDALVRLLAGEGGYLILDSEPALKNLRAELDRPNPNTGVYREFAAVDVRLNQAYLDLSAEALDELPDLVEELEAEDPVTMTELAPAEGNATAAELGIVPPGVDIFTETGGSNGAGDRASPDAAGASDGGASETAGAGTGEAAVASASGQTASVDAEPAGGIPSNPAAPGPGDDSGETGESAGTRSGSGRPPLEPEYVEVEVAAESVRDSCVWCRADFPARETLNYCPFCGTDVRFVPCASCGEEVEPGWRFCVACGAEVQE